MSSSFWQRQIQFAWFLSCPRSTYAVEVIWYTYISYISTSWLLLALIWGPYGEAGSYQRITTTRAVHVNFWPSPLSLGPGCFWERSQGIARLWGGTSLPWYWAQHILASWQYQVDLLAVSNHAWDGYVWKPAPSLKELWFHLAPLAVTEPYEG